MPNRNKSEEDDDYDEDDYDEDDYEDDEEYDEDDYDDEEEDDEEYDEDEVFKCRVCKKEFSLDDGDDFVLICDDCSEKYNMDQIWNDYDSGKIPEEEIETFDLKKYLLK
ncbi:MAG: hypothetical protein ACTSWY_03235 [Promethearchaeota archaeon]